MSGRPIVGIPMALYTYLYLPLWRTFFEELGLEVVVSGPTNKRIIDLGVREAVTDACAPIKAVYGHIMALRDRVDFIFLPRLCGSVYSNTFCPKILGLPDMIRHSLSGLPEILAPRLEIMKRNWRTAMAFYRLGRRLNCRAMAIAKAYRRAYKALDHFFSLLQNGLTPSEALQRLYGPAQGPKDSGKNKSLVLGVVGYPYAINDPFLSLGLLDKLRKLGVRVITPEMLPQAALTPPSAAQLDKDPFWFYSNKVLRAAYYMLDNPGLVNGIVHVSAFGCGPDSLTGKLIELATKRNQHTPFMSVTIDEQTGEAGIATRLEAFVDMIRRKLSPENKAAEKRKAQPTQPQEMACSA